MRITANQVTWGRLLLLPVPVAMIYQGETAWKLGALAVFILLGLGDALDGILARRHGSTPLGALLDPIVDKIFLIAAYIPVADHQIISTLYVSLIFIRELAVTVMRSIAIEEDFAFRTSRIAKLKTTVQMAGAGLLLLIWMFPSDRVIWSILGAVALSSLFPMVRSLARGSAPGWKAVWGGSLFTAAALLRVFLGAGHSLMVLMTVIVLFTLVSGFEYLHGMRSLLASRFRRRPVEAVRFAALSLSIPVLLVPAIELPRAATPGEPRLVAFLIMGILAAELAVGGLDNSLVHAGVRRRPGPDLLRSGVQAVCGALLLYSLPASGPWSLVYLPAWIALTVTLFDLAVRLVRNADVFRVSGSKDGTSAVSSVQPGSARSG